MIYLDRVETKWPLRIQLPVGTTVPFHCTASGKMYLSTLRPSHLRTYIRSAKLSQNAPMTVTDPDELTTEIKRVQERGYSTDNEEFMEGARPSLTIQYDTSQCNVLYCNLMQ